MFNYKRQKSTKLQNFFLILILIFTQLLTVTAIGDAANSTPFSLAASLYTDTQIKLEWNSLPDVQYYQIYKDSSNTPLKVINTSSDINYLSYTDTNLRPETQYSYKVRALDSKMNELASASTQVKTSAIVKPTILTASFDVNRRDITIKWTHNSPVASGSIIKIVTSSAVTPKATITDASTSYTFTDSISDNSEPIKYVIASRDIDGHISADSDPVSVIPIAPPAITATMSNGTSTITWTDNKYIEDFTLEISRYDGSSWGSWLDTNCQIVAGTYSISHTPDTAGTFRYRLNAKNSSQYSGYSNISGAVSKPGAPTNLLCTFSDVNKIQLSWTNDTNNMSNLKVERKIDSGTQYFYRLRIYNDKGDSAYYTEMQAVTNQFEVKFGDISAYTWAKDAIESLAAKGIIKGKGGNYFAPKDNTTRAEFVSIIIKTFKLSGDPGSNFKDVKATDWFYKEVAAAKALGIISGTYEGNFLPNKPITRQDIAVIIDMTLKAAGKSLPEHDVSVLDKYSDKKLIKPYALSSIASLNSEGIMNVRGGSFISPADNASRAEASVLIYKIMNR